MVRQLHGWVRLLFPARFAVPKLLEPDIEGNCVEVEARLLKGGEKRGPGESIGVVRL